MKSLYGYFYGITNRQAEISEYIRAAAALRRRFEGHNGSAGVFQSSSSCPILPRAANVKSPRMERSPFNSPQGYRLPIFQTAPHLEVHQCGCSYFPGIATLQRSTKEFFYQVPTSMHVNVFKHHLYNTRVKAVTAIPPGRFMDP